MKFLTPKFFLLGSGGVAGSGLKGVVDTFADLPTAAPVNNGHFYLVRLPQGTWLLGTKKRAGRYESDGATWTRKGALPINDAATSAEELLSAAEIDTRINRDADALAGNTATAGPFGAGVQVVPLQAIVTSGQAGNFTLAANDIVCSNAISVEVTLQIVLHQVTGTGTCKVDCWLTLNNIEILASRVSVPILNTLNGSTAFSRTFTFAVTPGSSDNIGARVERILGTKTYEIRALQGTVKVTKRQA